MKKIFLFFITIFTVVYLFGCGSSDKVAPIIMFSGENNCIIEAGTKVDLMENVTGIDDVDLNITNKIIVDEGGFDFNKAGEYKIVYSLEDKAGNEAEKVERVIKVVDYNKAKLVAHRGGKGFGLENTKEAFEKAIANGYYGLECDIQFTKDKVLVVYHDLNLKRLGGIDIDIKNISWDTLKDVTLTKNETDGKTYTGKVLLFKDYLTLVKNSNSKAFIELKETSSIETVDKMMEEINEVGLTMDQYVVIGNSSCINLLIELRNRYSEMKLQFVARTNYQNYMTKCLANKIDLDVSYEVFDQNYEMAVNYLNMFKQMKLDINIWVLNDEVEVKKFLLLGADFITTDSLLPKNK